MQIKTKSKFNKAIICLILSLLSLTLIVTIVPNFAYAAKDVSNLADLRNACKSGGEINITKNITVKDSPIEIPAGKTVTIQGGKSIIRGDNYHRSLFDIKDASSKTNGKLILKNITVDGDALTDGKQTGKYGEALIYNNGYLEINSNTVLQDNYNLYDNKKGTQTVNGKTYKIYENTNKTSVCGSAIYSDNGTVVINGGTIKNMVSKQGPAVYMASTYNSDKLTIKSGSIHNCTAFENGGAIFAGIRSKDMTDNVISVEGGSIHDNYAAKNGGAIWLGFCGNMYMSGGNIYKNTAIDKGGGIYCGGGTSADANVSDFGFLDPNEKGNGSSITTISDGTIYSNSARYGGGIATGANGYDTQLYLNGGLIGTSENGTDHPNTAYNGGGVYCNKAYLKINGAIIQYNTATNNGGGVYIEKEAKPSNMLSGHIYKNHTAVNGGGIYNRNYGVNNDYGFNIHGGYIFENSADDSGGGICNVTDSNDGNGRLYTNNAKIYDNSATNNGGGIFNNNICSINNTEINNNSTKNGGAIYNSGSDCSINSSNLHDNQLSNNGEIDCNGGAVYNIGTCSIDNTEIKSNYVKSNGGGIFNKNKLTISNTTFENNSTNSYGGAIHNSQGDCTLTNTTFIKNNATTNGGAISTGANTNTLTINSARFGDEVNIYNPQAYDINLSNSATENGGAIYCNTGCNLTINSVTINGNKANNGGGIYLTTDGPVATINNCFIINNIATANGGGICSNRMKGLRLNANPSGNSNGCTIRNNRAQNGGGIAIGSTGDCNIGESGYNTPFIYQNKATNNGGGIYFDGKLLYFERALILENNATNNGGGVYFGNSQQNSSVKFAYRDNANIKDYNTDEGAYYSTRINNNTAQFGGGIYNLSTMTADSLNTLKVYLNHADNGVGIYNTGTITTYGGVIYDNYANKDEDKNYKGNGGGVYNAENATFNALSAHLADDKISYTSIYNNKANYGGGIFDAGGYVTLENSVNDNTAQVNGGGIYCNYTKKLTINDTAKIHNNTGLNIGAGIAAYQATIEINNIDMHDNSLTTTKNKLGGAIGLCGSNDKASSLTINGGRIYRHTEDGQDYGTIYCDNNSTITMNGGEISNNNVKYAGGAIYMQHGTFTMNGGTIKSNKAPDLGGAIRQSDAYNTSVTIDGGKISNNTAKNGGAIYCGKSGYLKIGGGSIHSNQAHINGGAIYLTTAGSPSNMFAGVITNNSANQKGGAIYTDRYGNNESMGFNIHGGTISNNHAIYGGGVYSDRSSRLYLGVHEGNSAKVKNNTATLYGGGIYCINSNEDNTNTTLKISGSEFTSNKANSTGGAISLHGKGSIVEIENNAKFDSNKTTDDNAGGGGAIYNDQGKLEIDSITVTNNTTAGYGGGIFNNEGSLEIKKGNVKSNIKSNTASYGGGIFNGITTMIVNNATIEGNKATINGGGIYCNINSKDTINGSTITGNTARGGAGIGLYKCSVTINNTDINENEAVSGDPKYGIGGGIANWSGKLDLTDVHIKDNTATCTSINGTTQTNSKHGGLSSGILYNCDTQINDSRLTMDKDTYVDSSNEVYLCNNLFITVKNFTGNNKIRAYVSCDNIKPGRVIAKMDDTSQKGSEGLYWNPSSPKMAQQNFKVENEVVRSGDQGAALYKNNEDNKIENHDIFISEAYHPTFYMDNSGKIIQNPNLTSITSKHIIGNNIENFANTNKSTNHIHTDITKYWYEPLTFNPGYTKCDGYSVFDYWKVDKNILNDNAKTQYDADDKITIKATSNFGSGSTDKFEVYAYWKSIADVYYDGNGANGGINTNGLYGWYDKNVDLTKPYTLQGNENSFTRVEPRNTSSRAKARIKTPQDTTNVKLFSFEGWDFKNNVSYPNYHFGDSVEQDKMVKHYEEHSKKITFYATWDEYPTITAEDRWFTLDEAKAGKITLENLMSTAKAVDGKIGQETDFSKEGTFKIYDYNTQADADKDFKSFTTSGTTTITYIAIDKVGNQTIKTVTIHIVDKDQNVEDTYKYATRFISAKYYKDKNGNFVPEEKGGFHAKSPWVTKDDYIRLLTKTLNNKQDENGNWDNVYQTWNIKSKDLPKIREYVDTHGLGNSKEKNGLKNFITQFKK